MYFFVYKKGNEYYYKYKSKVYFYTHPLGYKNQYGHEIVLIIPVDKNLIRNKISLSRLIKRINKKLIRFLNNIDKKL